MLKSRRIRNCQRYFFQYDDRPQEALFNGKRDDVC